MKKILVSLIGFLALSCTMFSFLESQTKIVNAITNDYEITKFTSIPNDWELYSKCDTTHAGIKVENNELVISNSNTNNPGTSLYYGTVYKINNYTRDDFSFEIELKLTSYVNDGRWFGIAYHTNFTDNGLNSYLMNYRCNGNSAYSTISSNNSNVSFNDGSVVNLGINLTDGQYHTFKVNMIGEKASHYVDDKLITSWNGNANLTSGGFAIIVCQETISIKSLKISDPINNENDSADEELVTTYDNTKLTNYPTVICDVKNEEKLNKLKTDTVRPSNAIVHIDENMNVIDSNNKVLDTFDNVFKNVFKKQIIPVIYFEKESEATALINYLNENKIVDMAVMSNNPSLVKKVRESHTYLRGIIKFEEEKDIHNIVKTTNMNYGLVAVINEELATYENVSYIQGRFKTVWINQTNESDINIYSSINSGAYGLIVEDYNKVYSLYENYDSNSLSRTIFNVAHRGLATNGGYNENSIYAIKDAINKGATHIEIDVHLTKDSKLAVMHDNDISRTSNGTGYITNKTLSELQQYELDLCEPKEKIPSLEDVGNVIKDKNITLVLEIKADGGNTNALVDEVRKEIIEFGIIDQIVIISFDWNILKVVKEKLPEVPTASLNELSLSVNDLYSLNEYNAGVDSIYWLQTIQGIPAKQNMTFLRDRGYIGWYWTYTDGPMAYTEGMKLGIVGITNNNAGYYSDKIKYITGKEFILKDGENIEEVKFKINLIKYDGSSELIFGNLFTYQDCGDYYLVICSFKTSYLTNTTNTLYTQAFKVYKYVNNETPNEGEDDPKEDTPNEGEDNTPNEGENTPNENNPNENNTNNESNGTTVVLVSSIVINIIQVGVIVWLVITRKKKID